MILIITEKPFVSLHIAEALGIQTKPNANNFYEGNGYHIAYFAGWFYKEIPAVLKSELGKCRPQPASFPDLVAKRSKAYNAVMELMTAEDTDKILFMPSFVETDNIFDYLMEQCGCTKPSMQMSLTDLTANAIRTQINNMIELFPKE